MPQIFLFLFSVLFCLKWSYDMLITRLGVLKNSYDVQSFKINSTSEQDKWASLRQLKRDNLVTLYLIKAAVRTYVFQ
jgi:hypothetical protein